MAKKNKGKNKIGASNSTPGRRQDSITLRQEKTGKIKPKISNNVKTYLNHLGNLATWASGQASIPSLAAFLGQRLAAAAESSGVVPDPSLFLCQRCETVLQPGSNCSIRIEKNNAKRRRKHNKCSNLTQNNVVYCCHYCSCRNIKRGTPKGHMKVLYAQKSKAVGESKPMESESNEKLVNVKGGKECEATAVQMTTEILTIDAPTMPSPKTGEIGNPATTRKENILTIDAPSTPHTVSETTLSKSQKRKRRKLAAKNQTGPETSCAPTDLEEKTGDIPTVDAPATPLAMIGMTLLESKMRKRKRPSSNNQTEPKSSHAPTAEGDKTEGTSKTKRKRKSWTSLKEIAQANEQSGKQNVADLPIPFSLQGTF